jgi:hypothetical protein
VAITAKLRSPEEPSKDYTTQQTYAAAAVGAVTVGLVSTVAPSNPQSSPTASLKKASSPSKLRPDDTFGAVLPDEVPSSPSRVTTGDLDAASFHSTASSTPRPSPRPSPRLQPKASSSLGDRADSSPVDVSSPIQAPYSTEPYPMSSPSDGHKSSLDSIRVRNQPIQPGEPGKTDGQSVTIGKKSSMPTGAAPERRRDESDAMSPQDSQSVHSMASRPLAVPTLTPKASTSSLTSPLTQPQKPTTLTHSSEEFDGDAQAELSATVGPVTTIVQAGGVPMSPTSSDDGTGSW